MSVAPESVSIFKGMGAHYFQVQLEVGIPPVDEMAGAAAVPRDHAVRPAGLWPRVPLASANVSIPFNPEGEVRRPTLCYLITNAQRLTLEQRRVGDLGLELQVNGVLPQAASGFPGGTQVTEYIRIAESGWCWSVG